MKKLLTAILLVILTVSLINDVYARAGKGRSSGFRDFKSQEFNYKKPDIQKQNQTQQPSHQGYPQTQPLNPKPSFLSNPIFKWLIGGMIFGALLSLLMGHGFQIGTPGLLEILLILGVVYLIFRALKSKSSEPQPQPATYNYNYETSSSDYYSTTSAIPNINEELILNLAKNAFIDIQKSWSEGDLSKVRNFTTDRMYNYLVSQLEELKAQGLKNIVKDPKIENIEIVHVEEEKDYKVVIVEIDATAIDYTVDSKGNVIEGDPVNPVRFKEYWAFVGKALDWRLDDIKQVEDV
ncbi:MAG: Tim44-like domain-containing protein [Hydrogenothermaceae bacterium]